MAQMICWRILEACDLQGYTLIVPSVAVGNVGQLACDLLISSLKLRKIASLHTIACIPVLGYDPYDLKSDTLSGCCELYKSEASKILVLQLRSPLIFKYARQFLEEIIINFKEKGVNDVIVLTSSYAHEKKQIMSLPFRYVADEMSPYLNKIRNLKWIEHETLEGVIKIYGGGFAPMFYETSKLHSMPCTILYKYCSEGDNTADAYDMIQYLSNILDIFNLKEDLVHQLIQPVSWKFLFGRPPPRDIY